MNKKSNFKCHYHCHNCGIDVFKTKSQVAKITKGFAHCSLKCLGITNGKERKQTIIKNCLICDKIIETIPSLKETRKTCSYECQAKWQSEYLTGENANRFVSGYDRTKKCEFCDQEYECLNPSKINKQRFCSKKCKNEYWVINTLHNEEFKESWFLGNNKYRLSASLKETEPEKLVREYLDEHNINYIQEQGFFRKYYVDFILPESKTVIEVMGDYWHGNPEIYGEGKIPLSEQQIKRKQKDLEKKNDFISKGFLYFEIWEKDIKHNVNSILSEILSATTTRRTSN